MIEPKLPGDEVRRLMRKHRVTIRGLAKDMQITMTRVREVRERGLKGPAVRDWLEHITGHDPGPKPNRYRINRPSEEAACCYCGCPLYVGDWVFEYVHDVFCSKLCCRKAHHYETEAAAR